MISINELSTSYITEMEAHEVDSIFGGSTLSALQGIAVPNPATSIVISPIGGGLENLEAAFAAALEYAGLGGFVSETISGGAFGFIATQPTLIPFSVPASPL